mmetsp:Transcript_21354/g.30145  ORF Transcript_21354/g.30145 Transcript_21354/m.30145 type:complete len:244 (+) Transcript_21354:267-998(+)
MALSSVWRLLPQCYSCFLRVCLLVLAPSSPPLFFVQTAQTKSQTEAEKRRKKMPMSARRGIRERRWKTGDGEEGKRKLLLRTFKNVSNEEEKENEEGRRGGRRRSQQQPPPDSGFREALSSVIATAVLPPPGLREPPPAESSLPLLSVFFFSIPFVSSKNTSSTIFPVFAEHRMCCAPTESAYSFASASSTCLFFSKSLLFPAITNTIFFPTIFRSSLTQFRTLLKDSRSVMSYTSKAPLASL